MKFVSICLAVALTLTPIALVAQTITDYPLPQIAGNVCVQSSTGPLWYTDDTNNAIASMNSSGFVTEYLIPSAGASPAGCAFGPDGRLYFSEQNTFKVGAFDPSTTTFTEWDVPTPNQGMAGIAFDSNGNANIMITVNSAIQRMTTSGVFIGAVDLGLTGTGSTKYPHGPSYCGGYVWFVENKNNRVARLSTSGVFNEYPLPQGSSQPFSTACNQDGGVYFTEYNVDKIGRVDMTTLKISQWNALSLNAKPMGIATGYDGNIYFAESNVNKLAKMTPGGTSMTEYNVPITGSLPNKVTPCFSSEVCFSERGASYMGVFH